ncbi:MAG: hypothetical protein U1D54_08560 [Limnobacter sp.]|nr:hypothetical protein [Limnobacter sp.]
MSAFNELIGTPAFDLGEAAIPPPVPDPNVVIENIIVGYKTYRDGTLEPVYFSEDFWDLNLYKPLTARHNYYFFFESFENPQRQEIKELCYLWLNRHASSVSSILYCQPFYFKPFYDFARNHGISIKEALSDEKWIADFVHSAVSLTPSTLKTLKHKIKLIRRFRLQGIIDWGPPSEKLINALNSTNIAYEVGNQTSVIPSRIYCNLITGLSDLLNEFVEQDIANKFIALYEKIDALPYAGGLKGKLAALSTTKKGERKLRNTHTIESLLEDVGLTEWLKKYNHELNLRELDKLVIVVQLAARLWVHCFTGMRNMEVRSLPYVCLGKIESKGKQITVIRGLTSKLTGMGAINTMWVTNDIVQVAVDVAQDIGRYFAAYHAVQIEEGLMPLFPKKGAPGKIHSTIDFRPNTNPVDKVGERLLNIIPNITIEESDLKELERFQSFTPDFRKKFKVGSTWPLHTHQLRRSLAVYTARSNKVEIGAMTVQFKHLGLVMQEYYRRGSVWAVNLLESPVQNEYVSGIRGLVELIEINERLKQFDDFEERVINETGPLAGGTGSVFKRIKRDGSSIILEEDREYTKRAFLDGRTAFKESPIGWCTKREACDKIKITNDTQCIGCENSVFTPKDERKLLNHIEYLKTAKSGYSTGSMFEKHYALQIDKTEKTLAKIRGVNQ